MKKIVYFGNTISINYVTIKYLRKETNYTPDLLLQDYTSFYEHPAWEDVYVKIPQKIILQNPLEARNILNKAIKENNWTMPHWIKENPIHYSLYDKFISKYIDNSHIIKKQINHYVNDLKNYDLAFTEGFGAITARKAKVPYVIMPVGSDIDELPFEKNYRAEVIKKAIFDAKYIFIFAGANNLKKLGVDQKQIPIYCIIDTEKLMPQNQIKNTVTEFFLAARLDFQVKGTDKVIRAFSRLVKSFEAHLYCIGFGTDIEKTRDLVKTLHLEDKITFYNFVASKPVLAELYNKHDAVIADLGSGHIGMTELEAMACEKPVIANTPSLTVIEKELPILRASSEEEIYEKMVNVCKNQNLPTGMRDFVKKYFGVKRYVEVLDSVLEEL